MTKGDQVIVAALLAAALLSIPLAAAPALVAPDTVTIAGPQGATGVSLRSDGVYRVEGRLGEVVVSVSDGRVSVIDARCPDGLCVRSGYARPGRPVVCAPNGVSVSVSAGGGETLDAISR